MIETTQCIEGEGSVRGNGYRARSVGRYAVYQHRMAFELAWGTPIPDGMVVRHTCDRPSCVNPLHLMLGTQADNVRDRDQRGRNGQSSKTHCKRGHEYTEDNTYVSRRRPGRTCRSCGAAAQRASRARKAVAA